MQRFRTALMHLSANGRQVFSYTGPKFDRDAYSRFKYGWLPPAGDYAHGLTGLIADQLWQVADGRPISIVSAPYKFLPTASHAIAEKMCLELSQLAVEQGIEPPALVPFHKAQTGNSSYAKSSMAQRRAELNSLGLHIDESVVPGSVIVAVDDIRITGTAEEVTAAYLEPLSPHAIWYVHAARLDELVAIERPSIEDELNQTLPHTLDRFLEEAVLGEFQLNTRVLRFILESDTDELRGFAGIAPIGLLQTIFEAGVGSGVAYYQRYEANLKIVRDLLGRRSLLGVS